ncbi:MAG: hypothetical protein BIFFINMI_02789 [Phycisphaerae bacterium]|nr:hypothetical protein [Phycisphaerae bacterium]
MVGLCVIGVAAVVIDRWPEKSPVFTPRAASAAVSEPPAAVPQAMPERQSTTIARRLEQISGLAAPASGALRDVFQPGAPWVVETPASPAEAPKPQAAPDTRSEDFIKAHTLQAILSIGGEWNAVIDFKYLKVGDTCWGGYRVEEITPQAVILANGAVKVKLELQK